MEVVSFADGELVKTLDLPPRARFLRWTVDGRALTYVEEGDGSNVWSQPVAGGPPRRLTDFKSDRTLLFDWSRDGKQLAIIRGAFKRDVVLMNKFGVLPK